MPSCSGVSIQGTMIGRSRVCKIEVEIKNILGFVEFIGLYQIYWSD